MNKEKITIHLINGCEGKSISINEYRVAGNKPWGGGTVEQSWVTTKEEIFRALKVKTKEWNVLTDDEDSYPETFKYVLVEDDFGDNNVAYCDPDYDWYISNGENSLKLIGEVIKWKELE